MEYAQPEITDHATVLDTLSLARKMHPGQRNSLDALCKRYEVDASKRNVHGALIDAELLALVYLAMTGGQTAMSLDADVSMPVGGRHAGDGHVGGGRAGDDRAGDGHASNLKLVVIRATDEEAAAHEAILEKIARIALSPD
jgi:DNA polymerase-3 subunit epsilon